MLAYLEGIHIAKSVLNMTVNYKFGEPENLPAEMEGITEPTFLSLLCRESFYRFQVEVVVKMKIIEVLTVNE